MKKQKVIIILVFVIILGVSAFFYWKSAKINNSDNLPNEQEVHLPEGVVASSISGSKVSEQQSRLRPLAIVIDNSIEARPQYGLGNSEIVYETLAEGGVTRLLALFQNAEIKKIGPVRSSREYFALLANDWSALFAHVGGSPESLSAIATGKYPDIIDINQFYRGSYFTRDDNITAPHNVFTGTKKLYEFLGDQSITSAQRRTLFDFKDDQPIVTGKINNVVVVPAFKVAVNFSLPEFKVDYVYNPQTNLYSRNLAGKPHEDAATGKQLQVKTIVVQFADIVPISKDKLGRVSIPLVGQGTAQIFMDGKMFSATWKKSRYGRTVFIGLDGKELGINRGSVWVEIAPSSKEKVVYYEGAVVNPDGSVKSTDSLK